MKKNIWRILFWGIIAVICTVLGIVGYLQNNVGTESDRIILKNIANTFNSSSKLKEYESIGTHITASVKGRKIVIKYRGASEHDYTYTYEDGVLSSSFDKNDSTANNIMIFMTDAVAVYNGQTEGETYELFTSNEILNYNLESGIEIIHEQNKTKIKLNTSVAVISKEEESDEGNDDEIAYFLVEDFNSRDKSDTNLTKTKGNITLQRENEYIFTVSEKSLTDDAFESLKNILIYFYGEEYSAILDEVNFIDEANYFGDIISIEFNPDKNEFENINLTDDNEFIRVSINEETTEE